MLLTLLLLNKLISAATWNFGTFQKIVFGTQLGRNIRLLVGNMYFRARYSRNMYFRADNNKRNILLLSEIIKIAEKTYFQLTGIFFYTCFLILNNILQYFVQNVGLSYTPNTSLTVETAEVYNKGEIVKANIDY